MKKQMKKGLSLIMAVLMVMSCWVWIAPTKVEAADAGKYTLSIEAQVENAADTAYVIVKAKANNGTGSEMWVNSGGALVSEEQTIDMGGNFTNSDNEGKAHTFTLTVNGFPTYVDVCFKNEGTHRIDIQVKSIKINGTTVCSGAWTADWYQFASTGTWHRIFKPASASGGSATTGTVTDENGDSETEGTWNWEFPKFTNNFSESSPKTLTVPEITSSAVNSVAMPAFTFTDQYGVDRYQGNGGFVLTTGKTTNVDFSDENNMYLGTDNKVYIKANFQDTYRLKESESYKDYYVNAIGTTGTVIASQLVRVYYPTYSLTFNADYNTSEGDDQTKLTLKDGSTWTGTLSSDHSNVNDKKAYGQSFTKYPTNATKEGYEFLGFFTKEQPKTGDSSPYALKSQFKTPLTTAEYNKITDEALKASYCDAGDKFDDTNSSYITCSGNKTYYAWFIAKDVSVKFFTIGGKYIKEVVTKYGKTGADVGFPGDDEFPATYQSGPFTYSNYTGKWVNVGGEEIIVNTRFIKDSYLLTPQYEQVDYNNSYSVTFYKGQGNNTTSDTRTDYTYRAEIEPDSSQVAKIPNSYSDQYTYSFIGWTTVEPVTGDDATNHRHLIREDADVSLADGKLITFTEDFTVRDNATYYPVYRAKTKSYDVKFTYVNSAGTWTTETKSFKYGEYISVPDSVPTEYAKEGKEYKLLGWCKNNTSNEVDNIRSEKCTGAVTYIASYDTGTNKPYTITFIFKNDKGEDVTTTALVNHGEKLEKKTVEALTSAAKYDDGKQLWTFDGSWVSETAGSFTTDALLSSFSPTSHTTFKANYSDPKDFYKVTYVDGSKSESYRVVDGDVLPEWTVTKTVTTKDEAGNETTTEVEEAYEPSKASTDSGKYVFIGWADAKQSDDQILAGAIAGNEYKVGKTQITKATTLYAQYEFSEFTYTIEFLNYDGTLLEKGTFHYGESLADIEAKAEKAATKPSDDTYHYEFMGWDKKVPDKCEGGEDGSTTTYKAQFKSRYNYYYVQWFNTDAQGNVVNPDGTEGESPKYIESNTYTYGDRIYTPSESFNYPAPSDGKSYVLSGWKYYVGDTEYTFTRNTVIDKDILSTLDAEAGTKGIKMYAVYSEATQYHTVTVIVPAATEADEEKTYIYTVEDGETIANLITDPADGYVDKDNHQEFSGWVTKSDAPEGGIEGVIETPFEVNTAITDNITIYAKFQKKAHTLDKQEVIEAPTYPMAAFTDFDGTTVAEDDGKGVMLKWCACNKDETKQEEDIPALTDKVKPEATTYVGTTNWGSIQEAYGDNNIVYANPNTDLIITTSDKGDVNELYNPDGNGIGVQSIKLVILEADKFATAGTAEALGQFILLGIADGSVKFEEIYSWTEIQQQLIQNYGGWASVPEKYKNYNANYSAKLEDFDLTDGKTYVAIYMVADKANNSDYFITGKFYYDETAPVITINGLSNAAKDTYCGEAKVTVNDEDASVTDYDTVISKNDKGEYIITTAGQHKIVATDKAGNKTTKYFVVNEDHNFATYTQNPTCTAAGHTSQRCTNCGFETDTTSIPALGHKYVDASIDATCTAYGTKVEVCERCGDQVTQVYKTEGTFKGEDGIYYESDNGGETPKLDESGNKIPAYLLPALGHDFDAGVVTLKASCISEGILVKTCTRCGDKHEEAIPIDEDAHSFGSAYVVKASCTVDGYRKHTCRYCSKIETIDTLKATGHTQSDEYSVIKEATCYSEGEEHMLCAVCGGVCLDSAGKEIIRDIPMTDHFWVKDEANCKDPTVTEKGYVAFKCGNEGCTAAKGYEVDKLVESTVTFMSEDGQTELYKFTLVNGSGITQVDTEAELVEGEAMVVKPTKASTQQYDYTFMGWFTKDDNGNYTGNAYTLPMTVSKDLVLYARFSEKAIVKTLTFRVPTAYDREEGTFKDEQKFKELIGTVGDTKRLPAEIPTLKGDDYNSFEFEYWQSADGTKFDGTVEDNDTLTAKFKVVNKKYSVNFMDGVSYTAVKTINLDAGEGLTAAQIDEVTKPVKAKNDTYHYVFEGWYTESGEKVTEITDVTDIIFLYAHYTAVEHSQKTDTNPVITRQASCTESEITEYTCGCGHKWTAETKPAKGHIDGNVIYNDETGENDVYCSVCGKVIRSENASYNVKFMNGNMTMWSKSVKRNSFINTQAAELEEKAIKSTDDEYSYTFDGWTMDGDESGKVYKSDELPAVTGNVIYYAHYESTPRVYTIVFATGNNETVVSFIGVKYGTTIDQDGNDYSKFEYDEELFPAKKSDTKVHYVFSGWDSDITKGATKDLVIRPVFKEVKHNWDSGYPTGATCEAPGGTKFTCTECGFSYVDEHDGKEPAKGHDYAEEILYDSTFENEGKKRFTCKRCGKTYDEAIPCKELYTVTVTVKDTNGVTYEGAKVVITHKVSGNSYGPNLTDKNGVATFKVPETGDFFVSITDIPGHNGGNSGEITVGEDGKVSGTIPDLKGESKVDCSCACHRNGFWGMLFRFFHKIIKLFAGRYICCDCPDSRY